MALTANDLLQPVGMLTSALFPQFEGDDGDLFAFLDTQLAAGYAKAEDVDDAQQDDAAAAWAYHRAYEAVWQRLSATPSQGRIDGESSYTYTAAQVDAFRVLSERYLAQFDGFVEVATTSGEGDGVVRPNIPTKFTW